MQILDLDVRGLSHPEPLERSVAMFARLGAGIVMRLHIHRLPTPLLQIAQSRGIEYGVCRRSDEYYLILFSTDASIDPQRLAREACEEMGDV